jgi:phosphatidylserine/phosphatidylglycerophosphate/cardiolipin synthase-like enzyme
VTFFTPLADTRLFFGGPDQEPRALRNLLEERIDGVPAGGSIDWITYYFRDELLARALIQAHRRGVSVRVCLDGAPLYRDVNDGVIELLSGPGGIGDGLRVVRHFIPWHLHTKLYCFSHPRPAAFVGSFNPSGNIPEDPEILARIGDQDRGHNLLVQVDEPHLLKTLADRVAATHSGANPFGRLYCALDPVAGADGGQAYFFPRLGGNPLDERFARLPVGSTLRIAASHFADLRMAKLLAKLARRGSKVEVLTHHTQRRSPGEVIEYLRSHGVRTYRYEHPDELPMHAKFILAEGPSGRWSAVGSYNLNWNSRLLNQELLVFSNDPKLWHALGMRWDAILSEPWCKD